MRLVDVELVAAHAPPQRLVPRGNKPAEERARLADGLESEGSPAIASIMRSLAP